MTSKEVSPSRPSRLSQAIEKQMFNPKTLSLFFNQLHVLRSSLRKRIQSYAAQIKGDVLDFGCGSKPYASLFSKADTYVGVDTLNSGHNHENSKVDFYWDGKSLPFEDESFDCCVAFEVFEHIFSIEEVLGELYRVLRPGGKLLISTPFVFGEHEVPFDFARYTTFGIRHVLTEAGFSVSQIEKTTTERGVLAHVAVGYLAKHLGRRRFLGAVALPPLMLLLNIWGTRNPKGPSSNQSELFLNLITFAVKPNHK